MKLVPIVSCLLLCLWIESAWGGTCSQEFNCNEIKNSVWTTSPSAEGCSSNFAGFPELQTKAQNLASLHLQTSMNYLLFASHFGAWQYDRKGFSQYFSKLSDAAFDEAITIIQHMSKRGGKLSKLNVTMIPGEYMLSEVEALTKALDMEKSLALETIHLMHSAGHGHESKSISPVVSGAGRYTRLPDGEFAHFLAEEISEKHADRVHSLAAHVNNLGDAVAKCRIQNKDPAFLIHLYDTTFLQ